MDVELERVESVGGMQELDDVLRDGVPRSDSDSGGGDGGDNGDGDGDG